MKRSILIAVLTMYCFYLNAQNSQPNGSDIEFGLKGGFTFALITGDGTEQFDGRVAFHIGAMVEFPITEKFSFQPELLYSSQGDKMSPEGMKIEFKFDYLNVPVLAKYYIIDGLSLELGPQIGFLLSSKAEATGVAIDLKDIIKSVDFGIDFGLGYKLVNGLNFSARYNLGLSNIVNNNGSIFDVEIDSNNTKNHNEVIQLSIGYFF